MMKTTDILTLIAMTAGVLGALTYSLDGYWGWVFLLASGLILFFVRLNHRMREKDFKTRRIYSILMFSSASLCTSAYLMMEQKQFWLVPLMVSAVLEFYCSVRAK
ncbi:MAG: hypothetical protein MR215_04555 [Bacteroidales bacterium]|nr:hypothetical protein [Bacteroidales bacterium]MDY4174056.1 hypothetical protein [Bacteroidales bacterium]